MNVLPRRFVQLGAVSARGTKALALAVALWGSLPGTALARPGTLASVPGTEAETGFLDVSSDPPAKILIDDADIGKLTPQPRIELKTGHHRLTLVTPDGLHKRTFGFTIEAGQTRKFTVHLAS